MKGTPTARRIRATRCRMTRGDRDHCPGDARWCGGRGAVDRAPEVFGAGLELCRGELGDAAPCRVVSRRCKGGGGWRHRLNRPRTMNLRDWKRDVAGELSSLGWGHAGARLLECGSRALVWKCAECGDTAGAVEIEASCSARVCPWCARRAAEELRSELFGAVLRVPEMVEAQRATVAAEVLRELAELELDERVRVRGVVAGRGGARAVKGHARTAARARILRRERVAIRAKVWGWRLVTISPAWRPWDASECTVARLRERLEDVTARWRRVWSSGLSAHNLSAAFAHVEISDKGHVHLHALVYGPWWSQRDLARVAGCMVDVRAVKPEPGETGEDALRGAVREVVKYAVKAPALRGDFVGGAPRRVIHPVLAARWMVATRDRKLAASYGIMRAAKRAAEVCDPAEEKPAVRCCASCGAAIVGEPVERPTWDVARAIEAARSGDWRMRGVRGAAGVFLPPRVTILRRVVQ